jgi:hypothetical protein
VICLAFYFLKVPQRPIDPEVPMDLEVAVEGAAPVVPPTTLPPVEVPA